MRQLLIGAGLLALLLPAQAAAEATSPAGARYTMQPVEGGLMKLDTQTGAMSFCSTKAGAGTSGNWVCEAVPEDRAALEAEIARLRNRLAALDKTGAGAGVPDIMAPPASPPPSAATPTPDTLPLPKGEQPSEEQLSQEARRRLDQAMDTVEQVFRRFLGMAERLQREESAPQDQKL